MSSKKQKPKAWLVECIETRRKELFLTKRFTLMCASRWHLYDGKLTVTITPLYAGEVEHV